MTCHGKTASVGAVRTSVRNDGKVPAARIDTHEIRGADRSAEAHPEAIAYASATALCHDPGDGVDPSGGEHAQQRHRWSSRKRVFSSPWLCENAAVAQNAPSEVRANGRAKRIQQSTCAVEQNEPLYARILNDESVANPAQPADCQKLTRAAPAPADDPKQATGAAVHPHSFLHSISYIDQTIRSNRDVDDGAEGIAAVHRADPDALLESPMGHRRGLLRMYAAAEPGYQYCAEQDR